MRRSGLKLNMTHTRTASMQLARAATCSSVSCVTRNQQLPDHQSPQPRIGARGHSNEHVERRLIKTQRRPVAQHGPGGTNFEKEPGAQPSGLCASRAVDSTQCAATQPYGSDHNSLSAGRESMVCGENIAKCAKRRAPSRRKLDRTARAQTPVKGQHDRMHEDANTVQSREKKRRPGSCAVHLTVKRPSK